MQLSLSLQSNLQNWPRANRRGLFLWWKTAIILLAAPRRLCEVLNAKQKPFCGKLLADDAAKTKRDVNEQS